MTPPILCFLSTRAHAEGRWIFVYADGRVEKRGRAVGKAFFQRLRLAFFFSEDPNESVLSHGVVSSAKVADACAHATRVLAYPKPTMSDAAHDPTQELTLEVLDAGVWKKGPFTWGRASDNDAPLTPVEGEEANQEFEALTSLLWEMQFASIGGR